MNKKNNKEDNKGLAQYVDITYIKPENSVFKKTEGGILSLKLGDEEYERVHLYRSFPFSLAEEYISVRDKEGEEIGIIESINEFAHKTRKLLEKELDWIYFCPDIKLIYSIKDEFGYSYWEVETDQGRKKFIVRGRDQSLTPITDVRYLITDVDGNRFQISDIRELDRKSFKMIGALI